MRDFSHIIARLRKAKGKREQDDLIIDWSIQELELLETEARKSGRSLSILEVMAAIKQVLPWLLVFKTMSLEEILEMINSILG